MELTTTQVSLIAAAIALAAPAITYRANAQLDRYRWVRERRAETYIDALAVLGRLAAYVSEPDKRPDPFDTIPGDHWRRFLPRFQEPLEATPVLLLLTPAHTVDDPGQQPVRPTGPDHPRPAHPGAVGDRVEPQGPGNVRSRHVD